MTETATATETAKDTTESGTTAAGTTDATATTTTAATETAKTNAKGTTGTETTSTATTATAAATAPEKYDLTLPEGGYVDDADVSDVATYAKAEGWTNDKAQSVLDAHAATLSARSAAFLAETKADSEYGGAKLEQTQRRARELMEKVRPVGTPRGDALRRLLDKTGHGNHIEVISFLADLGALMAEDTPARGGGGGGGKEYNSPEDLYRKTATG